MAAWRARLLEPNGATASCRRHHRVASSKVRVKPLPGARLLAVGEQDASDRLDERPLEGAESIGAALAVGKLTLVAVATTAGRMLWRAARCSA
jgi:hypothetical protein